MVVYRLYLLHVISKNALENLGLRKNFFVFPDRLMAENIAWMVDTKPVLKHSVLQQFLLEVLVSLAVETLGDNALEHGHRICRPAAYPRQLRSWLAAMLDAIGVNSFKNWSSVGLERKQIVELQQLASALFLLDQGKDCRQKDRTGRTACGILYS